jgi:molecular chaperone DnaK (HSP70)
MTLIAIDFGTSNTIVCTQDPVTLEPKTLKFDRLSRRFETMAGQVNVVPSLVFVQNSNQLLFGEQVRQARLGFAQPERLFQAFKRDLVAEYRPPARQLDNETYTAESISELFIKQLWQQVSSMQLQPQRVVFTVPVGAFELYLDWFQDLAQRLGLPTVQMVDESTAAALGYAVKRPGSVVLVVDFGGGTLDLSLIRTSASPIQNPKSTIQNSLRAEVLAKSDAYIGGVDIDVGLLSITCGKLAPHERRLKKLAGRIY